MICFHCGRGAGSSPVHCESPDMDGFRFWLCWHCFEGYIYEGGFGSLRYVERGLAAARRVGRADGAGSEAVA